MSSPATRVPVEVDGIAYFDLPSQFYPALVSGMADENDWHFKHNNAESHMAFLREWGPRKAAWARALTFPKGSVHLDLGAGEGILNYMVARQGYHSIAVETSATILHGARVFQDALADEWADPNTSLRLWAANIYDLPLADRSVDFITIKQVLHHLDDMDGLMREVARVLKPEGMVYVLWEPFYPSLPLWRQRFVARTRARETAVGVHHVYHTYATYRRLFRRWLTDPRVEVEYQRGKFQHHLTRNRFTCGTISASGRAFVHADTPPSALDRVQIRPEDFLRRDLLEQGRQTTLLRKAYIDSLLAQPNR